MRFLGDAKNMLRSNINANVSSLNNMREAPHGRSPLIIFPSQQARANATTDSQQRSPTESVSESVREENEEALANGNKEGDGGEETDEQSTVGNGPANNDQDSLWKKSAAAIGELVETVGYMEAPTPGGKPVKIVRTTSNQLVERDSDLWLKHMALTVNGVDPDVFDSWLSNCKNNLLGVELLEELLLEEVIQHSLEFGFNLQAMRAEVDAKLQARQQERDIFYNKHKELQEDTAKMLNMLQSEGAGDVHNRELQHAQQRIAWQEKVLHAPTLASTSAVPFTDTANAALSVAASASTEVQPMRTVHAREAGAAADAVAAAGAAAAGAGGSRDGGSAATTSSDGFGRYPQYLYGGLSPSELRKKVRMWIADRYSSADLDHALNIFLMGDVSDRGAIVREVEKELEVWRKFRSLPCQTGESLFAPPPICLQEDHRALHYLTEPQPRKHFEDCNKTGLIKTPENYLYLIVKGDLNVVKVGVTKQSELELVRRYSGSGTMGKITGHVHVLITNGKC